MKVRRRVEDVGPQETPQRGAVADQNWYATQIDAEDTSAPAVRGGQGKTRGL